RRPIRRPPSVSMGLLSNRIGKESLKAGDHIYSWRAAWVYAHHGAESVPSNIIIFSSD
uniref:LRAT domain-containing protein n=1 Tax=Aegilops tauschii subsp. strangulata TaxID=200361 RepID=A0A452Z7I9_AEGTS